MISIIAAIAQNNCIGKNNDLPWHLPEDLKHFKEITKGKTVLMGKNTFLSILSRIGKPLPNRKNVVLSTSDFLVPSDVLVYNNLEKALADFKNEDLFIIGGAKIFKETINLADKLYITHIQKNYDGDTFFPEIDAKIWKKETEENFEGYSFVNYVRKDTP